MATIAKDPASRINCGFDWACAHPGGEAVMQSDWSVHPQEEGGVTIAAAAHDLIASSATLAGGIAGHVYRVSNRVTMSDGQVEERSMSVRVEER